MRQWWYTCTPVEALLCSHSFSEIFLITWVPIIGNLIKIMINAFKRNNALLE